MWKSTIFYAPNDQVLPLSIDTSHILLSFSNFLVSNNANHFKFIHKVYKMKVKFDSRLYLFLVPELFPFFTLDASRGIRFLHIFSY